MLPKFLCVGLGVCLLAGPAMADRSIFDDAPGSTSDNGKPRQPPARTPEPAPAPAQDAAPAPAQDPTPAPVETSKPTATPQSSDARLDEANGRIARLEKENADLKSKVKELTDALVASMSKETTKDKTQQDREQRVTDAKAKAEAERIAKIQAGITLSLAELYARSKAKIETTEVVRIPPHAGYFGPLSVTKEKCTLPISKGGEKSQLTLTVVDGVVTEVLAQAK